MEEGATGTLTWELTEGMARGSLISRSPAFGRALALGKSPPSDHLHGRQPAAQGPFKIQGLDQNRKCKSCSCDLEPVPSQSEDNRNALMRLQ